MISNYDSKVSIIVSVYNESKSIESLNKKLLVILSYHKNFEIVYVNDGSADDSWNIICNLSKLNKSIKGINLNRNFGHEAAMLAGIDYATGDFIICMDADLQHPPELIPEMLLNAKDSEIVLMVTKDTAGISLVRKKLSSLYYKIINWVSGVSFVEGASDFFLINKKTAEILRNNYRERNRYLRGFIQLIASSQSIIFYNANKRHSGETSYSFFKLIKFSIKVLSNFSTVPLKISVLTGLAIGLFSLLLASYSIFKFFCGQPPAGYTTLIVFIGLLASFHFILLGLIGIYITNIYTEIKERPIYIVKEII